MTDNGMRQAGLGPSAVIGVSVGNALAFYDFLIFGIFAVQISRVIYPPSTGITPLLLALATFGVGFVTRPLGAVVIGRIGDRAGRKPAMLISFTLAGLAVLGQALVPPFATIGLAAPLLMLLFRLLLGFAIGGEIGPSTSYLIEAAPANRRGLYVSLQLATQDMAALVAGVVGFTLARSLSDQALTDWGWRVAMLIGVSIVPFGLVLRSRLEETLDPATAQRGRPTTRGRTSRILLLSFLIMASATVGTYGLSYLTVYAQTTLGMRTDLAFGGAIVFGVAAVTFDLVGGAASDRFGRKPVMLVGLLALSATLIPAFFWLNGRPTIVVLVAVSFWLSMLNAIWPAAALTGITEALPVHRRSEALALTYALAIAIFGGTTQFIVAWLTDLTGNPLAPAYYILAVCLVGLVAVLAFPETAPVRQRLSDESVSS